MSKFATILLLLFTYNSQASDLCKGHSSNTELCAEYFKKEDPCKYYFDRSIDYTKALSYEATYNNDFSKSTVNGFLKNAQNALDACGDRLSHKQRKYLNKQIAVRKRTAKRLK